MEMLPEIQNLEELDLQENSIEFIPKDISKNFPKLTVLRLSQNKIKNITDLQSLKGCAELRVLNLDGNPVTKLDDYSKKIRELLPNLDLLDSKDRDGETIDSGDDGKYSKASPKEDSSGSEYSDESESKKSKRIKQKKE